MSETDNRSKQNGLLDVRGSKLNIHRMGEGEPLLFLHGAQGLDGTEPALAGLASAQMRLPRSTKISRSSVIPTDCPAMASLGARKSSWSGHASMVLTRAR